MKIVMDKLYPPREEERELLHPYTGLTLFDVSLATRYSEVAPHEVDLTSTIGDLVLPTPILSAAMDTVSGSSMAKVLSDLGGCGIIYRTKNAEQQLEMVEEAMKHRHCLVANPACLRPEQTIDNAKDLMESSGFSTLPVVTKNGVLKGVLFTKDVTFKNHLTDLVSEWMVSLNKLKTVTPETPFSKIRSRLTNEKNCTVLPVVDRKNQFHGIYFRKDFYAANPSNFNGRPLVGMAVGVSQDDLARVQKGLGFGVGMFVIDSSHGNSKAVIEQAKKVVSLVQNAAKEKAQKAAVIAGNIADPEGYYLLANAGVDGVKCGIGSGSICTTSSVTGAAYPMFSLIRELAFVRKEMQSRMPTPRIIADGGIGGPGPAAKALGAGCDLLMAGEWLVAAKESLSVEQWRVTNNGMVYYRGMASKAAIQSRVSERYGQQKTAEEGIEGLVPFRGPLRSWMGKDLELVRGGFAHMGAKNLKEMHEQCQGRRAFIVFTGTGQQQNATRVKQT